MVTAARLRLLALALAAGGALALPAASMSAKPTIATVSPTDLMRAAVPFRDTVITRAPAATRQLALSERSYTTPDGTPIRLFISTSYTQREAQNQALVDFLGWLVHGKELARTRVYVLTSTELRRTCGTGAAACYAPVAESLYVPGDENSGLPLAQVLAHEYGHHIATNRSNAPWFAGNFGPKRWASYMNVCAMAARGELFPGSEDANYALNPGEGWAEVYRRLNEERARQTPDPLLLGQWPDIGWRIVDRFFVPDATALELASRDVLEPWAGPTRSTVAGRLTRSVTRTVRTPLDGRLAVQVTGTAGATVRVLDARGRPLSVAGKSVRATVCGQQKLTLALKPKRAGSFRLTLSTP